MGVRLHENAITVFTRSGDSPSGLWIQFRGRHFGSDGMWIYEYSLERGYSSLLLDYHRMSIPRIDW